MRNDIVPPKRPLDSQPPSSSTSDRPVTPATRALDDAVFSMPPVTSDSPAEKGVRKRLSRRTLGILAICFGGILVLALLIGSLWYSLQLRAVAPSSDDKVRVTIEEGSGLSGVARTLKQHQLIRNELAFKLYVRQSGKTGLLQSGTYRLGRAEAVPNIVTHLTSGNTDTFSITFLPGATLAQNRQALIDAGYSAQTVDAALSYPYGGPLFQGKPAGSDLEGYIYGETYSFAAEATPRDILEHVFSYYESVVQKNDLVNLYKKQGFSLYQGITMASIIQREVATPEDAAQVAQVFKKRYDMGMPLGSDVTYQYVADKTGQSRDVNLDSPYNTRRYPGLPPGPISTPGLAALKGVASPAPGDYLFFLSGDDDKTYFARTNEEHEKNIREHCQKKCQII